MQTHIIGKVLLCTLKSNKMSNLRYYVSEAINEKALKNATIWFGC